MKNALILNADTQSFTANGKAALAMSTAELTKQTLLAVEELSTVHGHRSNYVIRGIAWGIKAELNKMSRQADNTVSASMGLAIKEEAAKMKAKLEAAGKHDEARGTHRLSTAALSTESDSKLKNMSSVVNNLADWVEKLYAQYADHAQVLSALGDYAFELHPFQRAIEATFTVNNELDDQGLDYLDDDYGFEDEDDATAEWLADQELTNMMKQQDLRKQKVNVTQAMDSERKVVYEDVTKGEWIADRLHRSMAEWLEGAQYGAWSVIRSLVVKVQAEPRYKLLEETIGSMPVKSLPFATKVMRKAIDLSIRVARLEGQREYTLDRIHKMDNTSAELTIAAMSNAVRDDEVMDIDMQLRDATRVYDILSRYSAEFARWLSLVNLDTPITKYSTYMAFDPIKFVMDRMATKAKYEGETTGAREYRAFEKDARLMLGSPDRVESFLTDDGLELWGVHFITGTTDELTRKAEELGKLRAIQYRHDELAARAHKLEAIGKSMGMRNKKPTSPLELEAITNKFLF